MLRADGAGRVEMALDLGALPFPSGPVAVTNGEALHFQYWFRDTAPGGGAASNASNGLSVAFCPTRLFEVPSLPIVVRQVGFELEDFNGDGLLDMAAVSSSEGTVGVRLGLGFGEFGPLVVTPVGDAPRASAVGDLDNDGDLDLAVLLDADTDGLALLWNDGTGHFQAPSGLIDIGEDPQQLVLGDADGDADLDLFVRRWRYPIVELELRRNLGGAVFGSPELLASAPLLGDATVVDLDGDGDLDFLVPDSGRDLVHIRSNLGAGAFGPRWSLTVPGGPHFVTVADVYYVARPMAKTAGSRRRIDGTARAAAASVSEAPSTRKLARNGTASRVAAACSMAGPSSIARSCKSPVLPQ